MQIKLHIYTTQKTLFIFSDSLIRLIRFKKMFSSEFTAHFADHCSTRRRWSSEGDRCRHAVCDCSRCLSPSVLTVTNINHHISTSFGSVIELLLVVNNSDYNIFLSIYNLFLHSFRISWFLVLLRFTFYFYLHEMN